MTEREKIYAELLELGLLHLRDAARSGRADICEVESDHLHNLPSLLKGAKESSHEYYLKAETNLYMERIRRLGGPLDSALVQRYELLWTELRNEYLKRNVPNVQSLVHKLTTHTFSLFDDLEVMARTNRAQTAETIWYLLTTVDGRSFPDYCSRLVETISQILGQKQLEQKLLGEWPTFPELARINLCYAASNPAAMSTELARQLFHSPHATVHDRHLIAAGLAQSIEARRCHQTLRELLPLIGTYEDSHRQGILNNFTANALRNLERHCP